MHRAIATVSLSGTLEEKLPAIARAGFGGVEIFENDLVSSPLSPGEVRRRAEDLGLSIDLYQPFRDFEAVPPDQLARNLRRAERKFDVLEQLGTGTMLVCSNVTGPAVDDDDLAAEQLHELGRRAGRRGLRVAYEALAWGRHVDDYRHAWRIVAAADSPHLGVCLDSFHILSRGHDPGAIRAIPADKIFFLQLADAPRLGMDVLQWSRHYRCFPGQGGFDLTAFLGHVLAAGYRGPLSLEVFNDVFRHSDPDRTAVDALRSLLALEESVWSASLRERTLEEGLRGVELCAPPAPGDPSGYAFVEIAVDDACGATLERVLATLGFRHTGNHVSKPVQLWEQAGARVLLNRGDRRMTDRCPGDAVVTALALEVRDPARSARRAELLLAPILPRERGPAEADLVEIAAPDGTSVLLCRSDAGPGGDTESWWSDFARTAPAADTPAAATGIRRIDHVGQAQPFDAFDEAVLFYRSVLGLHPDEAVELAAPYGLLRSRALTSSDGSVRIAMNSPLLGGGDTARRSREPQDVAFACDDVLAAARAMRALGAELLDIPDNYYADLAARTDLEPDLLERMREFGVLYDRNEDGEFFHLYTPVVGHRLFFELVQRVGRYGSYGAANAQVRIAAQRAAETAS